MSKKTKSRTNKEAYKETRQKIWKHDTDAAEANRINNMIGVTPSMILSRLHRGRR